jgi:hypothetical protein
LDDLREPAKTGHDSIFGLGTTLSFLSSRRIDSTEAWGEQHELP